MQVLMTQVEKAIFQAQFFRSWHLVSNRKGHWFSGIFNGHGMDTHLDFTSWQMLVDGVFRSWHHPALNGDDRFDTQVLNLMKNIGMMGLEDKLTNPRVVAQIHKN
jgi:hypothetical protein